VRCEYAKGEEGASQDDLIGKSGED